MKKDNIYACMRGTKDLVSNRDRFIAYLREKRGRNSLFGI